MCILICVDFLHLLSHFWISKTDDSILYLVDHVIPMNADMSPMGKMDALLGHNICVLIIPRDIDTVRQNRYIMEYFYYNVTKKSAPL